MRTPAPVQAVLVSFGLQWGRARGARKDNIVAGDRRGGVRFNGAAPGGARKVADPKDAIALMTCWLQWGRGALAMFETARATLMTAQAAELVR